MTGRQATFVVPGDIDSLTGGYIYEKQVLLALRRIGWDVALLQVPGDFPDASPGDITAVAAALAALPAERPVLLDGFLPGAMPPEALAALRAPFVAITHHPLGYETGLAPERSRELCVIERANLARAAHVVVPSPHTAATLTTDFGVAPARITVAPPGTVKPEGQARRAEDPPLVLSVGQLVPRKGHDVLLRALSLVADLEWRAVIVGAAHDDRYVQGLHDLAGALRLAGRVRFAGQVAPEDLQASFRAASVFALATRYEGYGMVFAEALAHGLPIVTTTGGAVADTVPADAGLLVAPEDVEGFAAALRRVLSERGLRERMAAAAAVHGARLPGWEDTARIVGDVLAEVAR